MNLFQEAWKPSLTLCFPVYPPQLSRLKHRTASVRKAVGLPHGALERGAERPPQAQGEPSSILPYGTQLRGV